METTALLEAQAAAGPPWLAELRREAAAAYRSLPYPEGREEVWRYTDVEALRPERFELLGPGHRPDLEATPPRAAAALELAGLQAAGRAVHADGVVVELSLSSQARAAGVVWCGLEEAVAQHAEVLRPRLGALVGPSDPFRALSLAAHRGGTFLYVPAGVCIEAPFQALNWIATPGALVAPRSVVVVEEGAQVVFNDLAVCEPLERPTLALPVTEVFLGPRSRVGWVTWQDWGPGVRHLGYVKAHLDEGASLTALVVTLGGDLSRTWKECVLAGGGSESQMLGLYFAHGDQHFEHWTVQDHAGPHTTSDLLYKGALAGRAHTVYYGTIRVRRAARKSVAYQANRNLTLSPKARADTMPQLEIETSDVQRCTHGATVGRVDASQLFYLQTRGIPRAEAERLIVSGFFGEVLERVRWSGMHERLAEAISRKLEEREWSS